jgi:hypothetical protein
MWSFARCHDPTHLAGRPGPTSADPRLLDLWPGGRADAVPRERPAPARVATATDAPGPQLVRVLHGVPPGASGQRVVACAVRKLLGRAQTGAESVQEAV